MAVQTEIETVTLDDLQVLRVKEVFAVIHRTDVVVKHGDSEEALLPRMESGRLFSRVNGIRVDESSPVKARWTSAAGVCVDLITGVVASDAEAIWFTKVVNSEQSSPRGSSGKLPGRRHQRTS